VVGILHAARELVEGSNTARGPWVLAAGAERIDHAAPEPGRIEAAGVARIDAAAAKGVEATCGFGVEAATLDPGPSCPSLAFSTTAGVHRIQTASILGGGFAAGGITRRIAARMVRDLEAALGQAGVLAAGVIPGELDTTLEGPAFSAAW